MLQNTSIIKVGGGLVAVGGVGTTGYIYRDLLSEIWHRDSQEYLVQATEDSSSKLDNKYSCKFGEEKDDKCSVIKLDFTKGHATAQEIISSDVEFKETIKKDIFYKLIVDKYKIKTVFENGKTEILINDTKNQKISTLKIVSLINKNTIDEPSAAWGDYKLLVKANKTVLSTTAVTLNKCIIGPKNSNTEITCLIYEFNDEPSNKHSLDFSKIKKITDLNKVQAGKYYIIDFSTETVDATKIKLNDLTNIATISAKDSSTEQTSFDFVSKVISHIDASTPEVPTNNQGLILKNDFIKNNNHSTYIIVKSDTTAGTDGFSSDKGGYKCTVGDNGNKKTDTNCAIIELNDKEKTLSQITNSVDLTKTATLKGVEQKYFKIVVNNEFINEITKWDGTEKIKIISSGSNTETEYKKLDALFFVENNKVKKGQTTFSIINQVEKKADSELTGINTWNTYKCKLNSDTPSNDCDIYKFSEQPDSKNISTSLSKTISKVSTKEDWNNNNLYFIDWKTKKIDFSSLTEKNIEITVEVSNTDKIVATAKINFPLTNFNTTFAANHLSSSLFLV